MNAVNQNFSAHELRESWAPVLGLAAREVFERMLESQLASASEPFDEEGIDITSMVGLAGQVCGIMTVRCSTKSALLMTSKMLGVDAKEAGPEMWDAVGEVCNMVAGNFKNKVAGMGDACMLSVPTVITGADYGLHPLADSAKIEVRLLFEGLPLIISIMVNS